MTTWQAITWDVARAGGFTAYLLLTLSVAVGLALTMHWQSPRWPRIINAELHNFLTLLALVFTGVHVLAALLDPFTAFGLNEVLIPFASHYRPLWMALGIVALYLGLAIGLSTWLRPLIGYAWWRRLHVFTLLCYALVTVHGLATGSDTTSSWGAFIYFGSLALIAILLWMRLVTPATPRGRSHPALAWLTAAAALGIAIFAVAGPMRPGWNAVANNGNGNGQRGGSVAKAAAASQSSSNGGQSGGAQFSQPFSATLSGTLTQSQPDASGQVTLTLDAQLSGGTTGDVRVRLIGQQDDSGAISIEQTSMTLGPDAGASLYTGQLSDFSALRSWRMTATLSGASGQVQIQMSVRIQGSRVSGTIQGAPVSSSSPSSTTS